MRRAEAPRRSIPRKAPDGVEAQEHILDFAMVIGLNLMQAMCGPNLHPIAMQFGLFGNSLH